MAEERYNRISPRFWSDPKVLGWDDDTKLLAMYLLTCEHRTTEGYFRLPKLYMQADLEWSAERLAEPFGQLLADGFIEWDENTSVLLIVSALKNQPPQNPNQAKGAAKAIALLPPNALEKRFLELAEAHSERLVEELPERFGKGLPEPLAPSISSSNSRSNSKDRVPPDGDDAEPPQEDPIDLEFERFWQAYPKGQAGKPGGDGPKKPARSKWRKLTKAQREAALVGVENYRKHVEKPDSPFAAHATTWLNQERWEQWQEPAEGAPSGRFVGGVPKVQ